MMRKMLRTWGSKRASIWLKLFMVAPSILLHRGIDAPRTCARGRKIKAGEAVHDRQRAAVDQGEETSRRMRPEISDRHFTGENEGDGLRKEPENQQRATDQLDHPTNTRHRHRLQVGKGRNRRKAEILRHAVLNNQQAGDNA